MYLKNKLLLFFLLSFIYSDSPITSTIFYKHFLEIEIIKGASNSKLLEKEGCIYLSSELVPLENKLALINALSWKYPEDGKAPLYNFITFSDYLSKNYNQKFDLETENLYTDHEYICLSYLRAMDDYFNMEVPYLLIQKVSDDAKNTLSYNIIKSLIETQKMLSDMDKWCMIWKNYDSVINNKNFVRDLGDGTIKNISSYMLPYNYYCKK
jgi:hypothetical protein